MESYCGDEGAWSRYQSQERCNQWGVDAVDSFGSLDKSTTSTLENSNTDEDDFSCVTLMDELEMECIVSKRDQVEFSGVPGGISESSNCWTTFLNNQDYQRTNQTDENFVNSLIVDDVRLSGQFHSNGSLKSQGTTYSNLNNLTVDMSIDSPSDSNILHDMGSYQHSDAQGFPYSFEWEKKQSDASHENFSNMMNNAVPQQNTSLGNFETSVEETVLQEFGKAMHKMTDKTRLCFRDALYRLASNSDKSAGIQIQHGDGCTSEKPLATSLVDDWLRSADKQQALEYRTNTIDRTMADLLMFNKECHQELNPQNSSYSLKRPLAPL
ncbi:unnamed protein product [Rhodiola kirilowii]